MPQVAIGALVAGGAVASAGGFAAALAAGGLTTAFLQLGTGMVLSGITNEIMKPDLPNPTALVSARGPALPREIVYGEVRKGGRIIFLHETEEDGAAFLHVIYALAGTEIQSIDEVYFDGELAIGSPVNFVNTVARYQQNVIVRTKLGTDSQTAFNEYLPSDLWTSDHRCLGVPLVYLRFTYARSVFPRGLPNVTFKIKGRKVYDPRTATTVYSRNAALCLADYMTDSTYGLRRCTYGGETGINTASLIEAANICDESVTDSLGVSFDRYRCNGIVDTARSPRENIPALLSAMAGEAIPIGGQWHIRAGAYRTPLVSLTQGDLRSGRVSVQVKRGAAEIFNGVRGKFISPENDWQPDDFPAYQSSTYVTEDAGTERWADIALPFTTDARTAQRIAKIVLERARRQQVVAVPGKLSAWRAVSGDTAGFTFPLLGYDDKPFDVRKVALSFDGGGVVPDLVLRETSPLVYSFDASEEQIYAAAPATTFPSPFDIDPPGAPTFAEELYATQRGIKVRLIVSWAASPDPMADDYKVELWGPNDSAYRTVGYTDSTTWQIDDAVSGTWKARISAVSVLGIESDPAESTTSVSGLSAAPVDITGVTIQTWGGGAFIRWDRHADLDVRSGGYIEIRHSQSATPSWANSLSITGGSVSGDQTIAYVPLLAGTYLLRARDGGGLLSPNAIAITAKGAQVIAFANAVAPLTESPTWGGTKTNVTVSSGSLVLTDVSIDGVYEFSAGFDLTTVKTVRFRRDVDVLADDTSTTIGTRDGLISTWDSITGGTGAEIDVIVEGRFTDDDPGGTPTWTDWTRIDSTEVECRGAQFRATLKSLNPDFNMILSDITITADEVV